MSLTKRVSFFLLIFAVWVSGCDSTADNKTTDAKSTIGVTRGVVTDASVEYEIMNSWSTGFQGSVTITNNGAVLIDGWELEWTFSGNQQVDNSWGAVVTQSGAAVTAVHQSHTKTIPAGSSVTFGFIGLFSGDNEVPSAFILRSDSISGDDDDDNSGDDDDDDDDVVVPENDDDWLHTNGNKIVDKNGNEVWLTGANWFGFNTGTNCFDGIWAVKLEDALDGMAKRGINLLRVPISTQLLLEWQSGNPPMPRSLNDYVNPHLAGKNSLEIFDITVAHCKTIGMKIMLDVHSPGSDAMGHIDPLWYKDGFSAQDFVDAWVWFANRYKNDDTVIAYDLENEPHGKPWQSDDVARWESSNHPNNWKQVAQDTANAILAINPNVLIMVEGIEAYPKEGKDYSSKSESDYYGNWWGGNLRGVKDHPINLGADQDQLVYSPHDYGPMVYEQPWFQGDFTKESLYNDCWGENWAYIMEDNIAPLLIGEWGGYLDGGKNEKWMNLLQEYIVENRIHHTFWCYNANSGDTGGLVDHDFITWNEAKYAILEPALWKVGGKFVSLDHKIKLGPNGTHLGEVYK